jgi:hypothetical protein
LQSKGMQHTTASEKYKKFRSFEIHCYLLRHLMRLNFSFSLNIKYLKVVLCCSRYLSCEIQQRFIVIAKYRMLDMELQVE